MKRTRPYHKHKPTKFQRNWGLSVHELAAQENVSQDTLNMRVMNYGNPWQRKAKPNYYERTFGRTCEEMFHIVDYPHGIIAFRQRVNTHPGWLEELAKNPVNPDYENPDRPHEHRRGRFWLHENHPDYHAQRQIYYKEKQNGKNKNTNHN